MAREKKKCIFTNNISCLDSFSNSVRVEFEFLRVRNAQYPSTDRKLDGTFFLTSSRGQ